MTRTVKVWMENVAIDYGVAESGRADARRKDGLTTRKCDRLLCIPNVGGAGDEHFDQNVRYD